MFPPKTLIIQTMSQKEYIKDFFNQKKMRMKVLHASYVNQFLKVLAFGESICGKSILKKNPEEHIIKEANNPKKRNHTRSAGKFNPTKTGSTNVNIVRKVSKLRISTSLLATKMFL